MLSDLILPSICVILVFFLNRSYRKDPFAYANIAITSVLFFVVALIIGRGTVSGEIDTHTMSLANLTADFLWRFSRFLFIPICFLLLFVCISNVELLRKEGFRRNNFLGLIICFLYLMIINVIWYPPEETPVIVNGVLIFMRLMLCYLECTILSICINGYAVLRTEPVYNRDFVIILGCSISKKGKLRPLLKERVNRAIRFAWEQEVRTGKPVRYVPSGGQGSDEPISEGSAMELYLLSHSAEDYEVFPEKKSRNTLENLTFSKSIIDKENQNAKAMIVTTNYHVLRSGMLARKVKYDDATVLGSKTKWYFWPNAFLREIVAIFFMFWKVHIVAVAVCGLLATLSVIM